MANIGSFKKVGNEFQGEIVTLSLKAKGVRIVAETNRSNDNAPSHRIYVGRAEIGAAWSKRSEEGRDYLSLKLDDPSFNAPIYANLFDDEGGEGYTLLWSRPRRAGSRPLHQAPSGLPGGASILPGVSEREPAAGSSGSAQSLGLPRVLFLVLVGGRVSRSASTPRLRASRSTTSIPAA
jgi:uncharacterized protein (DUF736 family)